jgi:hypothetical protein
MRYIISALITSSLALSLWVSTVGAESQQGTENSGASKTPETTKPDRRLHKASPTNTEDDCD